MRRRFRCVNCSRYLRKEHFKSTEGYRFCDVNCYAEDEGYEQKRDQQWEEKKKAHGITAEDFIKMLFGAAFQGRASAVRPTAEPVAAIPPELYRKLIFLCHPDKHNNHPHAIEVTQWLLGERKKSGI